MKISSWIWQVASFKPLLSKFHPNPFNDPEVTELETDQPLVFFSKCKKIEFDMWNKHQFLYDKYISKAKTKLGGVSCSLLYLLKLLGSSLIISHMVAQAGETSTLKMALFEEMVGKIHGIALRVCNILVNNLE